MAKALKTIGTIAVIGGLAIATGGAAVGLGISLATTVGGVSAGALIAGGTLLSSVGSALQKPPEIPGAQLDRLNATIDPRAHRKTVLGSTAMPVDVRYQEWHGADQEFCDWVVAHASHRCEGVDEIWLNDELAWTATGGAQGKFAGYFSVPNIVLEGSAENTIVVGTSGRWGPSRRLTGCCYSHWRFRTTGLNKKAESPFAGGLPSRITVIGRGARLYDPRRDSTVAGGAGPMRAGDPTTWRYVTDDGATIGENVALQTLRMLLGGRINGKLATGVGLAPKRLDLPSFAIGANQCDEAAPAIGGGTEPRYRAAGVWSEGAEPRAGFDALLAACCGRFRDTAGRLSLIILHNDLALAETEAGLNDDDVVGGFKWDPDPALEAVPNVIRGKFCDPSPASLYQMLPYPEVALPDGTGIERPVTLDLGFVEYASQAQRIAWQTMMRRQLQRTFTAPFDIRAWRYPVGSIVPFTFGPLSFERRLFRVVEQEKAPGGVCNMTLSAESAAIYAPYDPQAPITVAPPLVFDPYRPPLPPGETDFSVSAGADGALGATLVFEGECPRSSVTGIVFSYRRDDEVTWNDAGLDDAGVVRKVVSGVAGEQTYYGGVQYRERGGLSDRTVIGPVTLPKVVIDGDDVAFALSAATDLEVSAEGGGDYQVSWRCPPQPSFDEARLIRRQGSSDTVVSVQKGGAGTFMTYLDQTGGGGPYSWFVRVYDRSGTQGPISAMVTA